MGRGIAITVCRGGFDTLLVDSDARKLAEAVDYAESFLTRSTELGKLSEDRKDTALSQLYTDTDLHALRDCDLVIEAIFEDLELKSELLRALDAVCGPDAIFATNTSTLSITELGAASGRPEQMLGLHYCLPAERMRLIEVTPGLRTSRRTLEEAIRFCEASGQKAVLTKDEPGFILNAFAVPLILRAVRLVEEQVALPGAIDRAIRVAFGHAMGPFELYDHVGLDTLERLANSLSREIGEPRFRCPPLVRRLVAAGQLGNKAGGGFLANLPETDFESGHGTVAVREFGATSWVPVVETTEAAESADTLLVAGDRIRSHTDEVIAARHRHNLVLVELQDRLLGEMLGPVVDEDSNNILGYSRYALGDEQTDLIELVVPARSNESAIGAATSFFGELDLEVSICSDQPGRILDRLMRPYLNDALRAVDRALADAREMDACIKAGLGYRFGPNELASKMGHPQHVKICRELHRHFQDQSFIPPRRSLIGDAA